MEAGDTGDEGAPVLPLEAGADTASPALDSGSPGVDSGVPGGDSGSGSDAGEMVPDSSTMGGDANPLTLAAPRPLAPMSTATATSQTPRFHWSLPVGVDGAQVSICQDRACAVPITTFLASGSSGAPSTPLAKGVYFWQLRGTAGGVVGVEPSATWEVFVGARSASADHSWGSVLDVNGDGLADVVVSTYGNAAGGAMLVRVGTSSGPAAMPEDITPAGIAWRGGILASAGDVNGDGFADLVTGAGSAAAGAGYVFYGGASGLSPMPTTLASPMGPGGYDNAVAGVGDVDGDGFADVVALSVADNAYLYLGGPSGVSTVPTPLPLPGQVFSVAAAGDLNGDGFGDVVFGDYQLGHWVGVAYVLYGSPNGLSTNPVTITSPSVAYEMFGYAVACAGDVNGDGFADLVVGAPGGDSGYTGVLPTAFVYTGGAGGVSTTPVALASPDGSSGFASVPTADFASTVSGGGDVDGDGFADVVVASPRTASLHVYRGSALGVSTTPASIQLVSVAYSYPGEVTGGGDVNGDGFADVVMAAEGTDYFVPGGASGLSSMAQRIGDEDEVQSVAIGE